MAQLMSLIDYNYFNQKVQDCVSYLLNARCSLIIWLKIQPLINIYEKRYINFLN